MTKPNDGPAYLPGDLVPDTDVERMIRVNHAGEYGAARIYAGQLAILGKSADGPVIREMADQEQKHLDTFSTMIKERHVRPTALQPVWHAAGFALGAATAILGNKAAMACTVAVEEVIDEHYRKQADRLDETESGLRDTIEEFRADELDHRDTGLAHGAEDTPGYFVLTSAVKAGSRLAIWLSERF